MSDLSGLSSIGGTLSALQDTGLREFIETNSGSWTGGVEYSAISGKLAPEDIVVFTYGKQSAAYPYILSAYSAGKWCFAKYEFDNEYYPLLNIQSANPAYGAYSGWNRATFGKWIVLLENQGQSVWSGTITQASMKIYFVDGASDKSGSDGWSYGWTTNTFYPQPKGSYYSATNPSGFITGVDLTPYQTTAGMAGYIPQSSDNLQFGSNTAQTRCFALGSNVSASDNSFALGQNNSARSYSIALGGTNIANSLSLSIGGNNSAQTNSLAVGNTNSATTASEAVGYYNTASENSLTVGQYNSAGSYSIAIGYQSRAYWNSIALSNGSANTGSLAIGGNAHTGSIAIGSNANSAANYSQALGYNVSATDNCMAIGKLNATTNAAFVIGNGYTANTGGYLPEYHYSDAFIIDHSGNVSAAGKISANGVELVSFPSSADDVCQAVVSNSANWGDIPTKVVATSADATGSNILYVVTGE